MLAQWRATLGILVNFIKHRSWELASHCQSPADLKRYRQRCTSKYRNHFEIVIAEEVPPLPVTPLTFSLFLLLFLLLAVVFSLVYPFFLLARRVSHWRSPPRPLKAWEKASLVGQVSSELIERLRIVPETSLLSRLITSNDDEAIALDEDIYKGRTVQKLSPSTIRHESVHCLQFKRVGGFVPFLSMYFSFQISYCLYYRTSWFLAYCSIPFELEAYAKERL